MIEFTTPEVRTAFHLLPLDMQREWRRLGESFSDMGRLLIIEFIYQGDLGLEVSIRLDKKFNHVPVRSD